MAYELTDRAWNAPLEGIRKLVFLALCSRAKDHTGQQHYKCWPSIETIASDCGISERCARDHVNSLIDEGYISRRRRGMLVSVYSIMLNKLNLLVTHERQDLPVNPAESAGHERQDLHTEPGIEPVTQPVKKPVAAAPSARPVVVNQIPEIPGELFAAWMQVRKTKKRKVLTTVELDDIRAEAAKAGLSLADTILSCVKSNWARFEAHWLQKTPATTVPSATPVAPAVLEKMAAQKVDSPPLSPEDREIMRAAIERIKSTPVKAKHKLSWAEDIIADRRAGKNVSYGTLKLAMDALGMSTWKEVSCAA